METPIRHRTPGEYADERRGKVVRSPWHAWGFDIRTGRSFFDPRRVKKRTYLPTVDVLPADSFAVSVEGRYVVVDI